MNFYNIASLTKIGLGVTLLLVDYFTINPYEDPMIAIGLGLVGFFVLSWGASFYLFYGIQRLVYTASQERYLKDSYKLSLLFGIFCLMNVLLLLLGYWNKWRGIVLLIVFIGLGYFLFVDTPSPKKDKDPF